MAQIHPNAVVEAGAVLGQNIKVSAFAFIGSHVVLKDNVEIMQGAGIYGDTVIDEGTKIYPYAIIGMPPQDIGYKPEDDVKVRIGKNNIIREFVTINAGTYHGNGTTRIGHDCFIMIYSHIAHDCQIGDQVIMANNATLAGHVEVGAYTVIGGMTPIHQFVKIGEGCMIAGASAVSQDIPPFCLAEGNRAVVRGLNAVGIKRRFETADIRALQHAYKKLFRGTQALKEAAEALMHSENNEKVQQMCRFILETKRGIPFERVTK